MSLVFEEYTCRVQKDVIIAEDAVETFDQLPVQENMLNTPSPVLDVTSIEYS